MVLTDKLGIGIVKKSKGRTFYEGSLPFNNDEPVYIVQKDFMEKIIGEGLTVLKYNRVKMPEELFQGFPDEIQFTNGISHEKHKLLLDRYFYGRDIFNLIFLRYASIDRFEKDHDFMESFDTSKEDSYFGNTYFDGKEEYDLEDEDEQI